MRKHIANLCKCFIAVLLVLAMADIAEAGALAFKITKVSLGGVSDGKQPIVIEYTVRNTSGVEYFSRLNHIVVEITGDIGNGRKETYQRKVDINYNFNPVLGPGRSKGLRTRFSRAVNPSRGWYRYKGVRVKILKYNARKAS